MMALFESVKTNIFYPDNESKLHINEKRLVSFSDPHLTESWEIPLVSREDKRNLFYSKTQIRAMRERAKAYETRAVKFSVPVVTATKTITCFNDDEVQRLFYSTEELYQFLSDFHQLVTQASYTDSKHEEKSKQSNVSENEKDLCQSNREMRESTSSWRTRAVKFSVPEVTASKTIRRFTDNEVQELFYSTDELYQFLHAFHRLVNRASSTDLEHMEETSQGNYEIDHAYTCKTQTTIHLSEKVVSVQNLKEYLPSIKYSSHFDGIEHVSFQYMLATKCLRHSLSSVSNCPYAQFTIKY